MKKNDGYRRFIREAASYYLGISIIASLAYGLWHVIDGPPPIDFWGWMMIVLLGSSFGLISLRRR